MSLTIPEFIVSAAAITASLVAAVVGRQQIASGPHLRHMADLLRESAEATSNDNQRRMLQSMHAATVGRIVARKATSTLAFLSPALLLGIALTSAVSIGLRVPETWNLRSLLLPVVTGWFEARRAMRLIGERLRVARGVRSGKVLRASLHRRPTPDGGRGRWESGLSAVVSASLVLAVARGASAFRMAEVSGWHHVFPIVGGLMTQYAASWIASMRLNGRGTPEPQNRDKSVRTGWAHPHRVLPRLRTQVPHFVLRVTAHPASLRDD